MEIITELKRLNNKSTTVLNSNFPKDQPPALTDEELVNQLKSGNVHAFEKLFRRYYSPLFKYAFVIVKQKDDAEEVVQELFYNIWKNKSNLKITSSFKSYAFRSAYNNSLQQLRKRNKTISIDGSDPDTREPGFAEHDRVQLQQLSETIEQVLKSIPERSKRIFEMNRYEGLKYHEIAEKLSISIKTVEANMSRTLKTFRKYLKEYKSFIILL